MAVQQVKEKDSQVLFYTHIYYDSGSKISIIFFKERKYISQELSLMGDLLCLDPILRA